MNYSVQIIGTFLFLSIFLFACQPDPCGEVLCGDYGTCQEGTCVCDQGFVLVDSTGLCNKEIRSKYLGRHYSLDYCSSGEKRYTLNVTTSPSNLLDIKFDNIYNVNKPVIARISTENTNQFTIKLQPFNLGTIEGFGYFKPSSKAIKMTYYVKVLSSIDTCSATMIPI